MNQGSNRSLLSEPCGQPDNNRVVIIRTTASLQCRCWSALSNSSSTSSAGCNCQSDSISNQPGCKASHRCFEFFNLLHGQLLQASTLTLQVGVVSLQEQSTTLISGVLTQASYQQSTSARLTVGITAASWPRQLQQTVFKPAALILRVKVQWVQ
jgi:hypothetical protein